MTVHWKMENLYLPLKNEMNMSIQTPKKINSAYPRKYQITQYLRRNFSYSILYSFLRCAEKCPREKKPQKIAPRKITPCKYTPKENCPPEKCPQGKLPPGKLPPEK